MWTFKINWSHMHFDFFHVLENFNIKKLHFHMWITHIHAWKKRAKPNNCPAASFQQEVCVFVSVCAWADARDALVLQTDRRPPSACVFVRASQWVCLSVCVKCDLGRFLKARWAVKRRCDYNFSVPLFPPQLHWYLVPATPISPRCPES